MASLLRTLTFVTASVNASSSSSTNQTIVGNIADIVKIKITPSNINPGELTVVSIYKHNTFSSSDIIYSTTAFSGNLIDPIETDGVTSTERNEGFVAKYEDGDNAQQLHIKITNSGTVAKTYTVTITYIPTNYTLDSYTVEEYGAIGDGTTDNALAFTNAIAALPTDGIARLTFAGGIYKTTQTFIIDRSNVIVDLNGAEILFQPSVIASGSDRALQVQTPNSAITGPFNNNGAAIALGDTSFTTAIALSAVAGDWLMIYEIEPNTPGGPDVAIFDWIQVASVVGTTVNTMTPFRVAFPGTHSIPAFYKITQAGLTQNVTVKNGRCRTTNSTDVMPGFAIANCRNILFDGLIATVRFGQPFYSFKSSNIKVTNCTAVTSYVASEFAESSGVAIIDNTFSHSDSAPTATLLRINMGTRDFRVIGNYIDNAADIAMYILDGPRDGIVLGNTIDFTKHNSVSNGIFARGVQNVLCAYNYIGGASGGAAGINFTSQTGMVVNITSSGNIIGPNIIVGFGGSAYGTQLTTDTYITNQVTGGVSIPNGMTLGTDITSPDMLLGLRSSSASALGFHMEIPSNSVYYDGFENHSGTRRRWFSFNDIAGRDFWFDQNKNLIINNDPTVQGGIQIGTAGCVLRGAFKGSASIAAAGFSANPIPANSSATAQVTVTGAAVGDTVMVSTDGNIGTGLVISEGYVSSANTVIIPVGNITTGGIAPTTRTYSVLVLRLA